MDVLQDVIIEALLVIVVALIGVITRKVVTWLNEKGVTEKLYQKREVIYAVVRAVEQIYKDSDGPEKLAHAKDMAINLLAASNIDITQEELEVFIEEAVNMVKSQTADVLAEGVSVEPLEMGEVNINTDGVHVKGSLADKDQATEEAVVAEENVPKEGE